MINNSLKKFKEKWEINNNWQLMFPLIGFIICICSGIKLSFKYLNFDLIFNLFIGLLLGFIIIKICIFFIKKLENKWVVNQRWELTRIFIVFGITGSSSVFIGRPVIKFLGISKDNLNILFYWIIFVLISLLFYQVFLLLWGFIFGQFKFFWDFEKKMLKRIGLGKFIKK
tara:strand:- start:373 stop:882 length:510 start_codon:yes stop_codon:yes gene_type:complete